MAQIVITFNDNIQTRVLNALAIHYGYQAKITDANGQEVDNPQNKGAFVRQEVKRYLKDIVGSVEAREAEKAAYAAAKQAADSEIELS